MLSQPRRCPSRLSPGRPNDYLSNLANQWSGRIIFEPKDLQNELNKAEVTHRANEECYRNVLATVLEPHGLTYRIIEDEKDPQLIIFRKKK